MLALPLPILTFVLSAVACGLVWRLDLGNRLARALFTGVFACLAINTLLIGLRFGYGMDQFIILQRVIPLFIGPLIYLGFLAFTRTPDTMRRPMATHLAVAMIGAVLPQIFPPFRAGFDIVIGLSYLIYALLILGLWRKGPDSLANAPLNLIPSLRQWILGAAGMLMIMLVFDTIIAISFALQRFEDAVWLISVGSCVSMISLIIAIVVFSKGTQAKPAPAGQPRVADDASTQLEKAARDLLTEKELYLDTDLTLERLAKRLHVPARALSEAINQTQKMNVSQYVNGFRLDHAADLLVTTDLSVQRVMQRSGFLTRSNFYREFERVHAKSPSEYRKQSTAH